MLNKYDNKNCDYSSKLEKSVDFIPKSFSKNSNNIYNLTNKFSHINIQPKPEINIQSKNNFQNLPNFQNTQNNFFPKNKFSGVKKQNFCNKKYFNQNINNYFQNPNFCLDQNNFFNSNNNTSLFSTNSCNININWNPQIYSTILVSPSNNLKNTGNILNKETNFCNMPFYQVENNQSFNTQENLNVESNIHSHYFYKNNFCNWFSFMSITTPIILKNEEILLKNYLNFFEKPSILGVDCLFIYNNSYIRKTFFPSLSSINIELNLVKENFNNTSNLNSTLDGSFFSSLSEGENLNKANNVIFFNEDSPLHMRPLFSQKTDEFIKSNNLENINLMELGENSWFSIFWTPEKNKNNCSQEINTSFLIYYKFRPSSFNNTIGYLPVIGIFSSKFNDEVFWFSNQSNKQNNLFKIKEDYYNNRIAFLQLMV